MQIVRNDITKVKEINVEIIKSSLKRMGSSTKAQIAEETGISVATCGKILNELCDSREVIETAQTSAGYGRPAKCYAYNGNFALVACIYIASDMGKVLLSAKVSNMLGEVQEEYTLEIGRASFDVLETTVGRLVEKHDTLRAVAIGIPGYITDGVVGLCNFIDLMGLPLRDMLQEKFPQLKIQVENDMNAAAYGFYKGNCNEKETTVAFIYSPIDARTGLEEMRTGSAEVELNNEQRTLLQYSVNYGAGFVSSGKILRGFSGFAGEVSFLPIVRELASENLQASVEVVAYIIGSIVPILNPEIVALTGSYFDEKNVETIRSRCLELISPQHMPQIILRDDVHEEYVNGLINLALEELSCGIMLVTQRA